MSNAYSRHKGISKSFTDLRKYLETNPRAIISFKFLSLDLLKRYGATKRLVTDILEQFVENNILKIDGDNITLPEGEFKSG